MAQNNLRLLRRTRKHTIAVNHVCHSEQREESVLYIVIHYSSGVNKFITTAKLIGSNA